VLLYIATPYILPGESACQEINRVRAGKTDFHWFAKATIRSTKSNQTGASKGYDPVSYWYTEPIDAQAVLRLPLF